MQGAKAALLLLFLGWIGPAWSAEQPKVEVFKGITLLALPSPPGATYDVGVVPSAEALAKLKRALRLIAEKSPTSVTVIEKLKKAGRIVIFYDPRYPNRTLDLGSVRVALFLVVSNKYFKLNQLGLPRESAGRKVFPVIVSRHGIKWPLKEMAAVLVHELAGHGAQHLEDRFTGAAKKSTECEAWLREEQAYQQFGMDKRSRKMIEFRQQLGVTAKEGHCSDFGRYLAREKPDKLKYLQRMNPDVPVLLSLFGQYIKTLEARGVAGRIEAARRKFSKQNLKKILTQGDPKEVFRLGRVFRDGGAGEPNPKLALLFFLTAAKKGYPPAQNYLGFLHQKGKGVPQDPREAVRWYRRSAGQGFAIAQINLGIMYVQGRGVQRDRAEAYFWLVLAERRSRGKIKAKAGDLRFAIERSLLPEQVKAARVRADKWRPRPVRRQ